MSSDTTLRHHTFRVTLTICIYWGCCAGCTLWGRYPRIYRVRILLLRRAPYAAHSALVTAPRAHCARRSAGPSARPQRQPSAGSPALRRAPTAALHAPTAGQCRPSAGHSVPPVPAFGRHSVPAVQPSAGLRPGTPCPSAGLRPANGLHSPVHCGIVCIMAWACL